MEEMYFIWVNPENNMVQSFTVTTEPATSPNWFRVNYADITILGRTLISIGEDFVPVLVPIDPPPQE